MLPLILIGALFIVWAAVKLVGVVYSFGAHKGSPLVNAIIGGGLAIGFLWIGFMIGGKQLLVNIEPLSTWNGSSPSSS